MTVYEGKLNEALASAFIVSTCQLLPKSFSAVSDQMHNLIGSTIPESKTYSISCGSMAEFYVRTLNTCISDADFLLSDANELAFSGDFLVIPNDMSGLVDTIACCKLESYHRYPGFVRLRVLGRINYNWKYKKYEFKHIDLARGHKAYKELNKTNSATNYFTGARLIRTSPSIVNGPATVFKPDDNDKFGSDGVDSVWCPQWPREAQNWPLRPRNYGWPTIATISEVLQNGCHVVYAQHRSCRDDKLQWRLSFSVAEVILLQSWTKIQQIVYHLLRFLSKKELIQKDCPKEHEVLCTYHLKTLMLWTCEEMPPEWWNLSSVFEICCDLLQKLSDWLKRKHCPNYFIPEANLFHEQLNKKKFEKSETKLKQFYKSSNLCDWFVENYIQHFIRTHIEVKEDINGSVITPHFLDFMLDLFEFRKAKESESLNMILSYRFTVSHQSSRPIIKHGFSSGLRQNYNIAGHMRTVDAKTDDSMSCLPTIENILCFTYYDNLLHILHAAYGIGFGEISWDSRPFVELIKAISMQPKMIRSKYHNFPKTHTKQGSRFQFLRAQDLMQNLTGINSRSEFQLVYTMSKVFLGRALEYDYSESNGIALAALAYLAALHFAASEYQQAKRLCLGVLRDHTCKKYETLNAGCLLFIDDVARIVGLCVLHKKIMDKNLHYIGTRLCLDLRLSPELFAHYVAVLSAERIFEHLDFHHDIPEPSFPIDEYFKTLMKKKCIVSMKIGPHFSAARQIVYRRTGSLTVTASPIMIILSTSIVKKTVIDKLLKYALENMTTFYNVFRMDFGIQCSTVDCYRALYLYKCRQYDEMMHLCEQILRELDVQNELKQFAFANVLLLPPLDSFFDRDVQSLLGFHTLFYYLSPQNDEMRQFNLTNESTFENWFASHVYFNKNQLSTSISNQNSTKCYYFLGRHFLARYLKVRYCVDCNLPCTEAMAKFAAQKINFPFERIIRRYLLQKLRIFKNN